MPRRGLVHELSSDDDEEHSPPKMFKSSNDNGKIVTKNDKTKKSVAVRKKGFLAAALEDDDDTHSMPSKTAPASGFFRSDDDSPANANNVNDDVEETPEVKPDVTAQLSDAQRARIERNRQKALLLKQARLAKMPTVPTEDGGEGGFSGAKNNEKMTRVIDTGGGFLIEEEVGGDDGEKEMTETVTKQPGAIIQDHLPDSDPAKLVCEICEKPFSESYLFSHFDCCVCDDCRDHEDKHRLITKTDAKNEYLLKDEDFFVREPPLKYILKKNPHNSRWGDMKLFLHAQVHARAMAVYGSEEALEEKHDQRDDAREKMRQKRFDKKVKELRKKVRSSLFTKQLGGHEHEFGDEEEYDSDKDEYSKKCKTCDHVITYEKM